METFDFGRGAVHLVYRPVTVYDSDMVEKLIQRPHILHKRSIKLRPHTPKPTIDVTAPEGWHDWMWDEKDYDRLEKITQHSELHGFD